MLKIVDPTFLCPLCAAFSCRFREICAFGEDQKPHGKVYLIELLEMLGHAFFILLPVPL